MTISTSLITEIISLGSLIATNVPTFITFIEKVYAIITEKRAPTADEWTDIIALVKSAGVEDAAIESALNSGTSVTDAVNAASTTTTTSN